MRFNIPWIVGDGVGQRLCQALSLSSRFWLLYSRNPLSALIFASGTKCSFEPDQVLCVALLLPCRKLVRRFRIGAGSGGLLRISVIVDGRISLIVNASLAGSPKIGVARKCAAIDLASAKAGGAADLASGLHSDDLPGPAVASMPPNPGGGQSNFQLVLFM